MDHISKHLQSLTPEKAPAQTSSSIVSSRILPALQDPDRRVIELKYKSRQIGTMTDQEVTVWGKTLLLKIHVITGWTIPDTDLLIILVDQFQKKLVESYPDMNPDEIEYAFRQCGTTVKDWGKAMNLSLIDQVLIPYLDERKRLSHAMEERNAPPPPQVILTDQQLDDIHRQDVENFYQRIRNGQVPYNLPDYFKAILVKDGLLKDDQSVSNFFVQRLGSNAKNIYVKE